MTTRIAMGLVLSIAFFAAGVTSRAEAHGGGLNACGCHFNHRTGDCHSHHDRGCGCECEPDRCDE